MLSYCMLPELKNTVCSVDKKEFVLHGEKRGKELSPGDAAGTKHAIMWWEGWVTSRKDITSTSLF